MRTLAFIMLLALACKGEDPVPSGRLERPSGLYVVDRGDQEDVLVVDSEAQGVKVLQRVFDENDLSDQDFVSAPAAFFPLVIPAPGFPTQVSATPTDSMSKAARAYVIAPGAGMLHVLDVSELDFGSGAFDGAGNERLGSFDIGVEVGPDLVPTDVVVVSSEGTTDRVALSLQGAGVPDTLAVLTISNAEPNAPVVMDTSTATIGPSPRGLALVGSSVVVSSAGSNTITEVILDQGQIAGRRAIDVGGPTLDIVDAAAAGAFAVRVDRPAVVHLLPSLGGLVRSTDLDPEPYTPREERGTPVSAGVIDTYDSPIAAAGFGAVANVQDSDRRGRVELLTGVFDNRIANDAGPSPCMDNRSDPPNVCFLGAALLMAHLDGSVSFITIPPAAPPRLAQSFERTVARVTQRAGVPGVEQCSSPKMSCDTSTRADAICGDDVVVDEVPRYQVFRATFQGSLVASTSATLTSTDGATYRLTDPTVSSFEDRLVRLGDSVLTQVQSLVCGAPITVEDRYAVGAVVEVEADALVVRYSDLALVTNCGDMPAPARAVRYQVRPSGPDVVLARVSGETILEVVERVTTTATTTGDRASFNSRLAFSLYEDGGFSCAAGATPCASDAECGSGRICEDHLGLVPSCPRFCSTDCAEGAEACLAELVYPECSSVELEIFPTVPFVVSADDVTNSLPAAAPADVVFSKRGSWLISYPGSRWLAEIDSTPQRTPFFTR